MEKRKAIPFEVMNEFIYLGERWVTLKVGKRLIEKRVSDMQRKGKKK